MKCHAVIVFSKHTWKCECVDANQSALQQTHAARDVEGVLVRRQLDVCLLLSIGSDQSPDLLGLDIVQSLDSGLDLALVALAVDDEDKGVDLLNLLHGGLRVQGEENGLVCIGARSMGN